MTPTPVVRLARRVLFTCLLASAAAPAWSAPEPGVLRKALAARGERFIEMPGANGAGFVANAAGQTMAFGRDGIEVRPRAQPLAKGGRPAALRYEFASAAKVAPAGVSASAIRYHWFVGARENWASDTRGFSQVTYAGLWPGIAATYSGDARGIKYHFDVAPGADAKAIRFVVRGASDARLMPDGAVQWTVGGSPVRDETPLAYQRIGGVEKLVPAAFRLEPLGQDAWSLAIEVGAHDPGQALVVDPAWTAFAGLVGGSAADQVYAIAQDAQGNTFACGSTASANLPALSAYDATANGNDDAFLVKFNAAGAPQFVTYFGGSQFDACTGIAVHSDGTVYVVGGTASVNFPFVGNDAGGRLRRTKATSDRDAFVAKFNAAGNVLVYSGVMGGAADDQAMGLAVDASGRAHLTGYTASSTFPVTDVANVLTGAMDAFAARIAPAGDGVEYSRLLGSTGTVVGRAIALAGDGSAYVAGEAGTTGGLTDLAATAGTVRTLGNGPADAFVAKIAPAGTVAWRTLLTGTSASSSGVDRALAIAIDPADGNLLVAGETDSASFPANDAGARQGATGPQNTLAGNMDGFLVRLSNAGTSVIAATYLGGTKFDAAEGVATDGLGALFVTGTTTAETPNTFPTLATAGLSATRLGAQDGFLARLSGAPLALGYSGFVGSNVSGSAIHDAMHAVSSRPGVNASLAVGGATSAAAAGFANATSGAFGGSGAVNGVVLRVDPFHAPLALTVVSGSPQTATINAGFAQALVVKVADADGLGVAGFPVTFTPPASGASAALQPATPVTTDGSGLAQVTAAANAIAGAYTVQASAAGVPGTANFQLTNQKIAQTITFPVVPARPFTAAGTFGISATASSGLTVAFAASPASVCTIAGTTVTIVAPGTCTITASQPGDASYAAALPVVQDIAIKPRRGVDLSGDGKSDLVWQNGDGRIAAWVMNGLAATATAELAGAGSGYSVALLADFDNDGRVDLVVRHTDGSTAVWLMNGAATTSRTAILTGGLGWTARLAGDLDGDGRADIVWTNADGRAAAWLMNGAGTKSGATILGPGTGWSPTRLADFDGDGKSDILWTHTDGRVAIWLMNGLAIKSSAEILAAGSGWSVAQAADLDGDGRADIVWQHTDGSVAAWLMNGTAIASGATILGPGTGWTVTHAADFDVDGKVDLAWRHADGRVAIWLMNGLAPKASTEILAAGSGWTLRRTADLDGDGKLDILWQHTDGSTAAWLMNGMVLSSGGTILGPGTGWSVTTASP